MDLWLLNCRTNKQAKLDIQAVLWEVESLDVLLFSLEKLNLFPHAYPYVIAWAGDVLPPLRPPSDSQVSGS